MLFHVFKYHRYLTEQWPEISGKHSKLRQLYHFSTIAKPDWKEEFFGDILGTSCPLHLTQVIWLI